MDDRLTVDIDGVLANFVGGILQKCRRMGFPEDDLVPHWTHWNGWDPIAEEAFSAAWSAIEDDLSWWTGLEPYGDAYIDASVNAYVTARPIPSSASKQWLEAHGFPPAPVRTVGPGNSKKEALRSVGADVFIDDKTENARAADEVAGVTGVLLSRPWNRGEEAPRRIQTISELT